MKLVVVNTNNDDGGKAVIVDSVEEARAYIVEECQDIDPPFDAEEQRNFDLDLSGLTGLHTQFVRGSQAWKEVFYVSPLVV